METLVNRETCTQQGRLFDVRKRLKLLRFSLSVILKGSIISVVGKTTVEDYGAFSMYTKSP
ncbi:hypothetical protein, partial [Streptococcus salivarius]|uniref:hypothetical protein n=1 Tax=Streptococcus salivarius TaxID=1304 RepID=UPI0019D4F655